ncbi:MAG: hypothetical protein IKL27_07875 [Oscillospiraceae bacterium]|nr:hypothetical protein [Oscillospiraceae bacterium]
MKNLIIRTICLALCALFLCSCAATKTSKYHPDIPADTLPDNIPTNWELYQGDIYDITAAGFELYKLIYPNADVAWSSMGIAREGFSVDCGGLDMERLAASGIVPEHAILEYAEDIIDSRLSHNIPRAPKTEGQFKDGVTMRVEHEAYPPCADYIEFTLECERNFSFDYSEELYKYVDGEWNWVARTYYARAGLGGMFDISLDAGVPETRQLRSFSNKLGVGLYRLDIWPHISGYDEIYSAEFVVKEDAEPLEPLPLPEKDTKRGYPLNFFWQCELPENCTALTMTEQIEWPVEACSYSVASGWSNDNATIARELLGEDCTYDAETDTYTAGAKTLRIGEADAELSDSAPQARVMELLKDEVCDFSSSRGTVNPKIDLDIALRHMVGQVQMIHRSCSPANGILNFALKDYLTAKKEELSPEEYAAQYAELEEVQYLFKQKLAYYSAAPMVSAVDEFGCTSVNGGGISGPEVYGISIDGDVVAISMRRMFGSIAANEDTAATVSPYDAADAILPELWNIEQEFSITGAKFEYAYHGEDHSVLHPTWVFTVECADGSELYFGVDALTGELVK